jgi:hypothetical protein
MITVDFSHLAPRNRKYPKQLVAVANGAIFSVLAMSEAEKRKATNILYLHVQRQNRKCYIGITIMAAEDRWGSGVAYRNNRRFGSSIKKHGWDAFDSYVIAFAKNRDALNKAEVAAIAAAGGHKSKFTYNLSPGGDLVAENDKPIVGVHLPTGEIRSFKSGADAARQLKIRNSDMPMAVARGERTSVADWWFKFASDDKAYPPKSWGYALGREKIRAKQAKQIVAINYKTGEQRLFDTTSDAARALKVHQSAVSMVARGDALSAKGWWFKFQGDNRSLPEVHGGLARWVNKRDRKIYAVQLASGERIEFRNCKVADNTLGLYKGAAAMVASGERTSAAGWWFSYSKTEEPPKDYKGALVAKARSKPVVATQIATGSEQDYPNAKIAAAALGVSRAAISKAINGQLSVVKGYRFRLA